MASHRLLHLPRVQSLTRACAYGAQTAPRLTSLRPFHSTTTRRTDGVFKALTEMRVRKPWIEALRERREAEKNPVSTPVENVKPDLTPKRMSDSYVSVVLPLSVSVPPMIYIYSFPYLPNVLL